MDNKQPRAWANLAHQMADMAVQAAVLDQQIARAKRRAQLMVGLALVASFLVMQMAG